MISSGNDFAAAYFMLALESGKLSEFAEDLSVIGRVFKENPDFSLLITSPDIPASERAAAIDAAFAGRVNEYAVNFIKVLCDHKQIYRLEDCIKEFKAMKKAAENRVTAHVYSAVELSEEQKNRLKETLEQKLGRTVKIKNIKDTSVIGGIKVEIDGRIIDGSIKRQLHEIKEVISG